MCWFDVDRLDEYERREERHGRRGWSSLYDARRRFGRMLTTIAEGRNALRRVALLMARSVMRPRLLVAGWLPMQVQHRGVPGHITPDLAELGRGSCAHQCERNDECDDPSDHCLEYSSQWHALRA